MLKKNEKKIRRNSEDLKSLEVFGDYEIENQSKIRKAGAKNLTQSWQSIPHVSHFEEADITKIEKQRKESMGVYEGERTWKNVLSNGLVPALVLVITQDVRYFLAAVGAAQADKFGSEIGVLSKNLLSFY